MPTKEEIIEAANGFYYQYIDSNIEDAFHTVYNGYLLGLISFIWSYYRMNKAIFSKDQNLDIIEKAIYDFV